MAAFKLALSGDVVPSLRSPARADKELNDLLDRIAKIKAKHRRPVAQPDAISPSIASAAQRAKRSRASPRSLALRRLV